MAGPRPHPWIRHVPHLLGVMAAILAGPVRLGAAQQTATPNAVVQAQRLRDSGNLIAAAQLLREQLAKEPGNGDAARLLAQTLYWLKDLDGAQREYSVALTRHPHDTALRLDYARMLLETGRRREAAQLLTQLRDGTETQVEADSLLGTLAYWGGDLTAAQRLFRGALQSHPGHPASLRQLQEIQALSAPWIRVSSGFGRDDQPLDRLELGVEGGWYATPLFPVTVRVQPATYRLNADTSPRRLMTAEVELSHFAPAARLEASVAGGLIQRWGGTKGSDWTGGAAVGVRLPGHVTLRARADRRPYFSTTASLGARILVQSETALVEWRDPRGWLGEAAYQHQRFPDDNSIQTIYAWQMVPLVHRPEADLQAGYAFSSENAAESRFELAQPVQPFPVTDIRFNTAGRYSPYYTPSHLVSHSLIASTTLRPRSRATFRLRGGRAVHAEEDAPAFFATQGLVQRLHSRRTFSPWNAHGSVELALSGRTTLSATGDYGRTAFYTWWTTGVGITTRFRTTP